MITELMIILILVGAVIVFFVWMSARRRRLSDQERREAEKSTDQFKIELEKTANEIIGRMENQATHLENLLDDSERNRTQLEGRVAELRKLLKRGEGQSSEIKDLLARLDDAVDDVDAMQRQMDSIERKINAAMNMRLPLQQPIIGTLPQMMTPQQLMNPMMQNQTLAQAANPAALNPAAGMNPQAVPQMNAPRPAERVAATPVRNPLAQPPIMGQTPPVATVPPRAPAPPPQPAPAEDFASVLEKTAEEEEIIQRRPVAAPPVQDLRQPARSSVIVSRGNSSIRAVDADPVKIEAVRKALKTASAKISGQGAPQPTTVDRTTQERAGRPSVTPREAMENKSSTVSARSSSDIRRAAVAAIKNASETEGEISTPPAPKIQPERVSAGRTAPAADRNLKQREPFKTDTTVGSVTIRDMLLSGMSVEEVARETGLGRGAIELVQQMMRHQLERR